MPLPRIPAKAAVQIAAVAAKTYPDLYITQLVVQAQPGTSGAMTAQITAVPFNYDTNEAMPREQVMAQRAVKQLRLVDLEKLATDRAAAGKPALGQALTLVLQAAAELIQEQ